MAQPKINITGIEGDVLGTSDITSNASTIVVTTNSGSVNLDLPKVGSCLSSQFVKITTDSYGRVIGTEPPNRNDIVFALGHEPANNANDLKAIEELDSNGMLTRIGSDQWAARTINAGSSKVSVRYGDGVVDNPTIDVVEANLYLPNLGGVLGETHGGTHQSSYVPGDMLYASNVNTLSKLAGNATPEKKFLIQAGLVPSWFDIFGTPNLYTQQQNFAATLLEDGANVSWDLNSNQSASLTLDHANGTVHIVNNPTNMVNGGVYVLVVKQDNVGGNAVAFGDAYKWQDGVAPTISTEANAVDILTFFCDGMFMYGSIRQNFK